MNLIPVPKGMLAGWCRDIDLTREQVEAIVARTGSRRGVPRDTQRKRRLEVERIQEGARALARAHLSDPLWVAGTALYWCEGAKSKRTLAMTDSDPRLLRLYISWVRTYRHGHRKNTLPHGVCRVLMRRSTDALLRTMEWIDVLAAEGSTWAVANLPSGR